MKKGYVQIPIAKLRKAPWNYKTEDAVKSEKLKQNIINNGQIENIIVRELDGVYEVVNGNHRYDVFIDEDVNILKPMCFNLGDITAKQAKQIALETNETKFGIDYNILGDVLKDITEDKSTELLEKTIALDRDYMELLIGGDEVIEDVLADMNDVPITDDTIREEANDIDFDNREDVFFSIGTKVNEVVDESDVDFLYSALDKIKASTQTKDYVSAIMSIAGDL